VDMDKRTEERYKQQLTVLEGKCRDLEQQLRDSKWVSIGHCRKCDARYDWNLASVGDVDELNALVNKGKPLCSKCNAPMTYIEPAKKKGFFSRR
jgi:hypothetical protein